MKYILIGRDEETLRMIAQHFKPEEIETAINFKEINNAPTDLLPQEVPIGGLEKFIGGGV